MPITLPETASAYGRTSVVMVKTIADLAAPKLATEINATTSLVISCFLYAGAPGTVTTNKVTAPRKICTRTTFEQRGTSTVAVGDLSYSYLPQKALTDAGNKALSTLLDGTAWYMVVRNGKNGDTDFVAGDFVDIWRVELLNQNRTVTGDGEDGEFNILQPVIAKADPVYASALAA